MNPLDLSFKPSKDLYKLFSNFLNTRMNGCFKPSKDLYKPLGSSLLYLDVVKSFKPSKDLYKLL
ncbi:MAG: hypothetical protein MjAS7_1987 [Metallosphaera javensis (ex Sakai et al. 2022)]|nr:MAG: hypothetical protein MjAS7_1987 [Metallosphaera javensis (ex Sakai et al. 2022)]